jgi:hypothetical protein
MELEGAQENYMEISCSALHPNQSENVEIWVEVHSHP